MAMLSAFVWGRGGSKDPFGLLCHGCTPEPNGGQLCTPTPSAGLGADGCHRAHTGLITKQCWADVTLLCPAQQPRLGCLFNESVAHWILVRCCVPEIGGHSKSQGNMAAVAAEPTLAPPAAKQQTQARTPETTPHQSTLHRDPYCQQRQGRHSHNC